MKTIKTIDGVSFILKDGVFLPINEKKSSRIHSWITLNQIDIELPEFYDKIEEILTKDSYNDKARNFASSIMQYLEMWKWLSWKQFDSIFKICDTYNAYINGQRFGYYQYGSIISYHRPRVSLTTKNKKPANVSTDREFDNFYKSITGFKPIFLDDNGEMEVYGYRNDGSRYMYEPNDYELKSMLLDSCVPRSIVNNFFQY